MKILIKVLVILIVLVAAGAAALYFLLPPALEKGIKSGLETFGPQVTQTAFTVDNVSLSPFSGQGKIEGLFLGNPEGFQSEKAFYLGEIDLEIAPASLLSDCIVINKIHITQPEITYETTLSESNFGQLLKNIEAFTGTTETTTEETTTTETTASKKIQILDFKLEGAVIAASYAGRTLDVPLPTVQLNDIGKEAGGVTAQEATQEILKIVTQQALSAVTEAGTSFLKDKVLSGELFEGDIQENVEGMLDGGVENVEGAVKDAIGGFKGLFKNE